jgi:drug/metabolite transporter (DMT)-like permease
VIAAYVACAVIWGTTWYAIRVSIAGDPTLTALALRFAIAAVNQPHVRIRSTPARVAISAHRGGQIRNFCVDLAGLVRDR